MAKRPSIGIVGAGRAGGAIGIALHGAGYEIAAVWSRSPAGRRRAARLFGAPVASSAADVTRVSDLTFVCVPDDAIPSVARGLSVAARGRLVVHTSGAASVAALDPVLRAGGRTGCVHPLQTLPDPRRGAAALRGAAVALTCEPEDRALLSRVARAWGGRPFLLADEDKPRYHAAAVFASNYVIASIWAAERILEEAGIRGGDELLMPLVRATVENVDETSAAQSITGPAARGDNTTIRRHLRALTDPAQRRAYRAMADLVTSLSR